MGKQNHKNGYKNDNNRGICAKIESLIVPTIYPNIRYFAGL